VKQIAPTELNRSSFLL